MPPWRPSWLTDTLPTSFDATHGWPPGWWLCGIAALVVSAYPWLSRRDPRLRVAVLVFWGVAAFVSVFNYADYGRARYGSYVDEWDVYHYYLGTRYADELGYEGLYEATLMADMESGVVEDGARRRIRSLSERGSISVSEARPLAEAQRAEFSDARWAAFSRDVAWFRDALPPDRWSGLLTDAGYNGTPPWTLAVRAALTGHLDIDRDVERALMLALDPLLLVLMVWLVWRAFGPEVALALVVFWGTHYLLSWGHLKGSILRTDFAVMAVASMALMKMGKPRAAGLALAWATVARVFPGLMVVGLLARLLGKDVDARERSDIRSFLIAFAAFGALAVLASALGDGGFEGWREWLAKIGRHREANADWQVGLSSILNGEWHAGELRYVNPYVVYREEPEVFLVHKALLWTLRLVVTVPLLVFARDQPRHRALAMGFVLIFLWVAPTYYYCAILAVPFVYFAEQRQSVPYALSAGFMFVTGLAGYLFFSGYEPLADFSPLFRRGGQEYSTYYFSSWMIGITAYSMVMLAARDSRRMHREGAQRGVG